MGGDRAKAASIGVKVGTRDIAVAGAAGVFVASRMGLYALASRLPGLRSVADRRLVAKLEKQLASYGKAHFTTDAAQYRPKSGEAALAGGH